MQNITVNGRLGRDAVNKVTATNETFITFTLATNSRVKGAEKTTWYDVVVFNVDRYKNMVPFLKKGTSVLVVGELDASIFTGNDGVARLRLSIAADRVDFVSSGNVSGNTQTTSTVVQDSNDVAPADDDAIPMSEGKKKATSSKKKTVEAPVVEDEAGDANLPF